MKQRPKKQAERKSIFRALFAPLFFLMVLQALIFYFVAVYGGIEESLTQNAADILSERLTNRKNEIETRFNTHWSELDNCVSALDKRYAEYEEAYGARPLMEPAERQIQFLRENAALLIDTLRHNEVNGVFLILNDQSERTAFSAGEAEQKYGLCIRDMDQDSVYFDTEDLLLERAPSSIIDTLDCSLDSQWEAKYTFASREAGDYYYEPLDAAWENPKANGKNLAYCSGAHSLAATDSPVFSYSIPLIGADGYPYGVLGVELSLRYLASLMPYKELNDQDACCYILAMKDVDTQQCTPVTATGALYSRCFDSDAAISCADENATGGFNVTGRGNVPLYGAAATLSVYNNNNPFEDQQLTLLALVESQTLFAYRDRVKMTLMIVSMISLMMGLAGIALVSRRFASPITALAKRVRAMRAQSDFHLDRLGITEIDQLVDSIEELNRNVSRNSARTEFFSRMSHDMRTPMNAIISFSSPELLDGETEAVKDDYLKKIHASGEYLLTLINEVLDMTKIESNKTELHIERIQACKLFDTTTPIIEKLAQKKGVRFCTAIETPAGVFVEADVQHLNQIVMNLLSNAVKFTQKGGTVRFDAALTEDASAPGWKLCKLVVADTGVGMSEAFMERLYAPFEQESSSQEGTGLGLSIAKKLVELMDGEIDCMSKQHVGTTFTVTVPLAASEAQQGAADGDAPQKAYDTSALPGRHVLLCEDNAINTLIMRRLLERAGITMDEAENGQIGVEKFAASAPNTYDAVLMDIRMPVMDGLAATRAIRALDRADAAKVPIVAMTANAFEEDKQACSDAGMNAHLAKPVDTEKLFSTLLRLWA